MEKREFNKLYKSFKNMKEEEMKKSLEDSIKVVLDNRQQFGLDGVLSNSELITAIFALFIQQDQNTTREERELVTKLFKDTEYYEVLVLAINEQLSFDIPKWDSIIDNLSLKVKEAVTTIGLCLIACDKEINNKEKELFEKIYN